MQFAETTALHRIANLKKKIRAIQGGTSAGKTIAWLLYLIALSQTDEEKKLTSIVSESMPHLKKGAIRDFKNIMQAHHYWNDRQWNATDSIYTFETGSQIEFFSADNSDKLRGGRRDRCLMNEANNMTLDSFDQLEVRTREFIGMDWNPTSEFWFYSEVLNQREDVDHIILTYKENEALSQEIISSIESRKNRPVWWKVYGEGQLGELEGVVYTGWRPIDEVPEDARLKSIGLDFGYTNDPTAAVAIYEYNNGFIFDEVIYRKGMSNKAIADALATYENTLIIADSAEPKSIDEIKMYGLNIIPSVKGPGSVLQGIQFVQDQSISVTNRSTNLIKEQRGYLWDTDNTGKVLNKPQDFLNHCMDAIRYGLVPKKQGLIFG